MTDSQEVGTLRGNDLNDLSARQHAAFLKVADKMPRSSREDIEFAIKHGSIPETALGEVLTFFTKEGDAVLDVFSGAGRMLSTCSHANREGQGVDLFPQGKDLYEERISSDMFVEEMPYTLGDARDYLSMSQTSKFDFVFMDPPRAKSMGCRHQDTGNIAALKIEDYVTYVARCIELAATNHLRTGKFIAIHLDLVFYKGRLYDVPGMVSAALSHSGKVRQRITKIWFYDRNSPMGNLGIAASNINTCHLLAFESTN